MHRSHWLVMMASFSSCFLFADAPKKTAVPVTTCAPLYDNRPFVEADFIYWIARQEGQEYASTGTAITVPGTVDPNTSGVAAPLTGSGRLYSPHPEMQPGFKVALGMDFSYDKWDLVGEYTYFYGKAHSSVTSYDLNTGILPIFSYTPNNSILLDATYAGGATGFVSSASSEWNLHFNNLNLELGKSIQVSSAFGCRPHFGLQATWQKQHSQMLYVVSNTSSPTTLLGNNRLLFEQNYWGIGPRAGLDTTWQCCSHLGLFATSGAALLWGQPTAHVRSYDTNSIEGYQDVLIANQYSRPHHLSPMVQLALGAQTDWLFADRYRFLVKAGWEGQVWFFQGQHSTTLPDSSLILQGFTLALRCDF